MKVYVDDLPTKAHECLFVQWHYDRWDHRKGTCPFDHGCYCVYESHDPVECPHLVKLEEK